MWSPSFTRADVEVIEQPIVYTGHFSVQRCTLRFKLFAGGWGSAKTFETIHRQRAVIVLPYVPKTNQVVLVEQLRMPMLGELSSPWILEPIAGLIDKGEHVESAAKRESLEEAGCEIVDLVHVLDHFCSPGLSTEKHHIFLGLLEEPVATGVFGLADEGENIKTHLFDLEDALLLIEQGKIISASGIIALQWLKLNQTSLFQR